MKIQIIWNNNVGESKASKIASIIIPLICCTFFVITGIFFIKANTSKEIDFSNALDFDTLTVSSYEKGYTVSGEITKVIGECAVRYNMSFYLVCTQNDMVVILGTEDSKEKAKLEALVDDPNSEPLKFNGTISMISTDLLYAASSWFENYQTTYKEYYGVELNTEYEICTYNSSNSNGTIMGIAFIVLGTLVGTIFIIASFSNSKKKSSLENVPGYYNPYSPADKSDGTNNDSEYTNPYSSEANNNNEKNERSGINKF